MLTVGKMRKTLRGLTLLLSLIVTLGCAGAVWAATTTTIDFSNTSGYGISFTRVMVENIRLESATTNPFDPTHPIINNYYFNVPFNFDNNTLHLIPDLSGAVLVNGGGGGSNCADLTVNVSNAFTGAPLPGVVVQVGTASATTGFTGVATFNDLPSGSAQVTGTLSGYVTASRPVTLACDANSIGLALSPSSGTGSINANQVRVVLTWGQNPSDLDSHLTGPDPNNASGRFHLYYANDSGLIGGVSTLDVDDTSSFGPETVTISPPAGSNQLRAGRYRYSVHHYSGSSDISRSNATVTLQLGSNAPQNFSPPAGSPGDDAVWTVFELDVNAFGAITVYPVNTFTPNVSASQVQSDSGPSYGSAETGVDFTRLPAK